MTIEFTVFSEPVAKGRPRVTKRGITYTPAKTAKAEYDFKVQAMQYKPEKLIDTAIILGIKVYRQIPKSFSKNKKIIAEQGTIRPTVRPDWDNYGKLISDSLNSIFWVDDSLIVSCMIEKYYSRQPRIEVKIDY